MMDESGPSPYSILVLKIALTEQEAHKHENKCLPGKYLHVNHVINQRPTEVTINTITYMQGQKLWSLFLWRLSHPLLGGKSPFWGACPSPSFPSSWNHSEGCAFALWQWWMECCAIAGMYHYSCPLFSALAFNCRILEIKAETILQRKLSSFWLPYLTKGIFPVNLRHLPQEGYPFTLCSGTGPSCSSITQK